MKDPVTWARLLLEAAFEQEAQPARICELCVEMLGVSGAGIARITQGGHRGVVTSTDDVSGLVEELQLTLGEGPCVDAVGQGRPVLIPDLQEPDDLVVQRWPGFFEGASRAGVRAVFAFPLHIGAISLGAMDLYRSAPGPLGASELAGALLAADAAALALLHLDGGEPDTGQAATHYDTHVHQATGMVQAQLGISTEEAFLVLRARAFALSRPLTEVARDVVARRLRFGSEDS